MMRVAAGAPGVRKSHGQDITAWLLAPLWISYPKTYINIIYNESVD